MVVDPPLTTPGAADPPHPAARSPCRRGRLRSPWRVEARDLNAVYPFPSCLQTHVRLPIAASPANSFRAPAISVATAQSRCDTPCPRLSLARVSVTPKLQVAGRARSSGAADHAEWASKSRVCSLEPALPAPSAAALHLLRHSMPKRNISVTAPSTSNGGLSGKPR